MKKLIALFVCALFIFSAFTVAGPQSRAEVTSDKFRVWRTVSQDHPALYMYATNSSSGSPKASVPVGTILTVSNWYTNDEYCYATGPYGSGYVWKACLLRQFDYDNSSLATYKVTSEHKENGRYLVYMYAEPSSSWDHTNLGPYYNGDILKVVDWYVSDKYCYAVGKDGKCGFVWKDRLTRISGTAPNHADTWTEYAWEAWWEKNVVPDISTNNLHAGEIVAASSYKKGYKVEASSYYTNNNYNVTQYAATDNNTQTAWNTYGNYRDEWIELQPKDGSFIRAEGFKISNGYWKSDEVYFNNCRVKTLDVYVDDFYVQTFTIQDYKNREQTFYFDTPQVGNRYKFVITDAYVGRKYMDCAITELKLFGS